MELMTDEADQQVVLEEEIDVNYEPTERGTDQHILGSSIVTCSCAQTSD